MKDMGIVKMSKEWARPLIVNKDTVYFHSDIEEIETKDELTGDIRKEWQAKEIQMTLREFQETLGLDTQKLKDGEINLMQANAEMSLIQAMEMEEVKKENETLKKALAELTAMASMNL